MFPREEDTNNLSETIDFSKIKVGAKMLEDAILEDLYGYKRIDSRLGDKKEVMKALKSGDLVTLREISNFFYKTSGIYSRLCRYMAYLYRFDWMVTPFIGSNDKQDQEKAIEKFYQVLDFFDKFGIKRFGGEVFLKVIRDGCYYGYIVETGNNKIAIQDLPPSYCRSRFSVDGRPAVEFNMRYFDDCFRDTEQRNKVLEIFPKDFKKGYRLYKEGKLTSDVIGDKSGWYLLDINYAIKFNMNGEDFPAFAAVIPAIIDLDAAQELDRKKMAQRLLKIIIQKMPIDKNGDLVFDVDEAQQLHNNAVRMLGKAIGIDVLTTFADVDVASMSDNTTTTSTDELEKVERAVFNEAGVSQMQFNTDGNLALEKSILNDEASMYNLLLQLQDFLNFLLERKFNNKSVKKTYYKAQILTTTIYNYKEMAKLYKEQTQLGYSKMLPQIALGQAQSTILATAYFENDVLNLANVFIPPMMSSTMNSDVLKRLNDTSSANKNKGNNNSDDGSGRPTNESQGEETSLKTQQNKESAK